MPNYAVVFGIMLMGSVGLPLTIGFVGEFLSLLGFYRVSPLMTALAGTTIILGAVYMLVAYKNIFFGPVTNPKNETLKDLTVQEKTALFPLVALVVILGVYPKPILEPVNASVKQLVQVMHIKSVSPVSKEKIIHFNSIGEAK
jgi:NADH-quinone oxidoreductase subunit M